MNKRMIASAISLSLILGTGVGAYAASNSIKIAATLNPDLKIIYNGVQTPIKDASGKITYPISYNNTTYLPVRAISGLFNVPIDYDGKNSAVLLGSKQTQPTSLVKLSNTGGTDYSSIIRDASDLKITTGDGIQTYSSGIYWDIWNGSGSASLKRSIRFDVKGYTNLTFTAWSDVNAKGYVYDQNGKVFTSFEIPAKSTVTKNLTLDSSITHVGFAADGPLGSKGTMKILDPTVK